MTQRPPTHSIRENLDSIGFGKLTEGQMKAVVELVKSRGLLKSIPKPTNAQGRGIVIAAGGKYADWGYVNARWLRTQGFQDPIQIWHLGPKEYPDWSRPHFVKLDVELVDAFEVRKRHWHRKLQGWTCKQYAAMHAPFEEIVFLDADCFLRKDPAYIWDDPDYQNIGAMFFPDVSRCRRSDWAYVFASVRIPEAEMDSGLFFWNRIKAWEGIAFTNWIGEHSEVWDKFIYGDKDRPYLGFKTTGTEFIFPTKVSWEGWGIQHYYKGEVIAQHCMAYKRQEHATPHPSLPGFFEEWRSFQR